MFEILETVRVERYSSGDARPIVNARCLNCGTVQEMVKQNAVKSNRKSSMHCAHCVEETFHRMTHSKFWGVWMGIRWRTKDTSDKNYAGRGIKMCKEWNDFATFRKDMWCGYSEGLTIERIDVNGPYCKENCRWATNMEQQANKRNNRRLEYKGETIHLAELVRRSGFSKMMLIMRLNRGMTAEGAVEDCANSPYGKSQRKVDIRRREKRMSLTS